MRKVILLSSMLAMAVSAVAVESTSSKPGRIDARMMRQPDVSAKQIAFVYAGDIWLAPKSGGEAVRLSSPRGEESFPKFSPDGSLLAFSGNYDGNTDIYVMPVNGGLPRRITHHGASDRVVGWYPDGKSILFATTMTSYKDRFNQLYKVPAIGGLPEKLPMPYGEFGAISRDGKSIVFNTISVDFRTWKRYRGGMNPDLWQLDLTTLKARNLTKSDASESLPMWHGDTLYFLSDRDENKRFNIWALDVARDRFRQVTFFKDFDVHFPSIGPGEMIFENAGRLYLLDLKTEKSHEVEITITTDRSTLKPRLENVSGLIQWATISPTGKRALFYARGDIFSAPAEHGVVRNLTRSSGVAERYPAWSPDGKLIAYWSDRSGEYELTVRDADRSAEGQGEERTLTKLGPGYRYAPQWSPDSKKILWIDQAMKVWLYDFDTKTNQAVARQKWMYNDELQRFRANWSADSRWFTFALDADNRNSAIALYDSKSNALHQVTSGFYNDEEPVFDPDGKYLFFRTGRNFSPTYSDLDNSWIYANSANLAAVPLRLDVASPNAPRNDEESEKKKDEEKKDGDKQDEKKSSAAADDTTKQSGSGETNKTASASSEKKDEKKSDKKQKAVEIDLDGFEQRVVILSLKAGRYSDLAAVSGKLLYRRLARTGSGEDKSPLVFYDLEKREEKTILDDADDIELSANREKLLVRKDKSYSIIEPKESQKLDKKIETGGFEATIDPVAEWKQMFDDTWRLQRDLFYDPHLHGVDWRAMRERYGKLLTDAVTRWDVNYILGELIGELNSSHTYRSGGDTEKSPERGVGYLGCDFTLTNGVYRIAKIINGASWDSEVRSPLLRPGLTNVSEGDYLLAVNGETLDVKEDPWAAFQGLADKPVFITVNDKPTMKGARELLVQTLSIEARLRNLAWINENRKRVEKASDGKIGYVFVPDTGQNGQNELVRQFRGQFTKAGLIIDERFNSGGQIPDRFIELLDRPLKNFWGVRDGSDWQWPPVAHFGPKAMLVNGWSGSGGDCFPFYFKQSKLGPLIGQRTWGGLIGITGAPGLVDGGAVTVPTFGIYSKTGEWIIESYGVDPDIEVVDDPGEMARGGDPQLDRAVFEVMKAIRQTPSPDVKKPKYPDRAR
ncbi:MAG: peptidase S41 [Verrucomicrobia bacterium]|nr:peptidase S41 [Verrucomicrobiota bacterium]